MSKLAKLPGNPFNDKYTAKEGQLHVRVNCIKDSSGKVQKITMDRIQALNFKPPSADVQAAFMTISISQPIEFDFEARTVTQLPYRLTESTTYADNCPDELRQLSQTFTDSLSAIKASCKGNLPS